MRIAVTVLLLLAGHALPIRAMDRARAAAHVDEAVARHDVSGCGVIVAILDRGIDWRHPDFREEDGRTRILAIVDATDDRGAKASGNPLGFGTISTQQEIDDALLHGTRLSGHDAVGHGTATAGIACANGRSDPSLRGVAPRASLLIVKITSDGAPAHDAEPAEVAAWEPRRLPSILRFVRDFARARDMACVALLNVGSLGGPSDGTSDLCRMIDGISGAGLPAFVVVTGTSDDGGVANHARSRLHAGEATTLHLIKGADPVVLDLWTTGVAGVITRIGGDSPPALVLAAPASPDDVTVASQPGVEARQYGTARNPFGAQLQRREIWIRFDGAAGPREVELVPVSGDGEVDATLNPSRLLDGSGANRFLDHVVSGSLWDGASARHAIVPNASIARSEWTDIDGIERSLREEGAPGDLWKASGVGPTIDGRLGVDVAAPGCSVFTTYAPDSWWATFRGNLPLGGDRLHGRASAVSAAAPLVAGVVALMFEEDASLDAQQVKEILQQSARADVFTGRTPNATWGYGKLDAATALDFVAARRAVLSR